MNQHHFGGKTRYPPSFYYEFKPECRCDGNKLCHYQVLGNFNILRSEEGFNNRAKFSGEKRTIKLSGVSIF